MENTEEKKPVAAAAAAPAEAAAPAAEKRPARPAGEHRQGERRFGGNDRRGGHGGPRRFREEKEFEDRVVTINRVSKTVKGGRRMRFAALVVIGDKKGRIGYGMGKANEVPDAIKKATEQANKNVFRVQLVDNNRTIPHDVKGTFGSSTVVLKPAAPGTGVIAGGAVRAILELAGVSDIISKVLGSRTSINVVYATVAGLKGMKTVDEVAKLRGKKIAEIR